MNYPGVQSSFRFQATDVCMAGKLRVKNEGVRE